MTARSVALADRDRALLEEYHHLLVSGWKVADAQAQVARWYGLSRSWVAKLAMRHRQRCALQAEAQAARR